MLLQEHLEEYTREQLLKQARLLELKGCSKLRKADLIDRIVKSFCTEEVLRTRIACLTKEQRDIFRRACDTPQDISINQAKDAMLLCRDWIGSFEDVTDRFCVFEEIIAVFDKIDDEAFRADQRRKVWMMKCVPFVINYYGIAPIEVVYKLYSLKIKDSSVDDMINMLWDMPVDIVECCFLPMDRLGVSDWPQDDPVYSPRGLFIHIPILENRESDWLLEEQSDKPFYIPSIQQLEEIDNMGYEASSIAYKKLETFLLRKLGMPRELATVYCLRVWANSCDGNSSSDIIDELLNGDEPSVNEGQMDEFIELLMNAHNNTRMKVNRGHKPNEIRDKIFVGDTVTAENGFFKKEKKIYPNALCPCGSGRKYKKCCGRR